MAERRDDVCRLALEDGSVWTGKAFGATGKGLLVTAEVVFNTAMTGYQECLTDPSYTGQILVSTAPIVGVYGINEQDVESAKVTVSGFVIHELARRASNHLATKDLSTFLADAGVLGIHGIDTRALTRRLRTEGVMRGALTDDPKISDDDLIDAAKNAPKMAGQNLVPQVTPESKEAWSGGGIKVLKPEGKPKHRVLALDCGAKYNIFRELTDRGCEVVRVPWDTPAAEIRKAFESGDIDGLMVSNGPGDPQAVENTIATLRELVSGPGDEAVPTFGICLGHQLLALACGAERFKLKFGHRGVNQPVRSSLTGKIEITSQNHGFAIDPKSLPANAEPTHMNLNDGTLAGFRLTDRPVFSVQHHPEAGPGPHDASYLFDRFVESMDRRAQPVG